MDRKKNIIKSFMLLIWTVIFVIKSVCLKNLPVSDMPYNKIVSVINTNLRSFSPKCRVI